MDEQGASLMAHVGPGLRVGFWNPNGGHWKKAFRPMGTYEGPPMGDLIVGTRMEQKLMEGTVKFSVGVLFRPDRGKRQRLETILIIDHYVPEMWDYEHWEKTDDTVGTVEL